MIAEHEARKRCWESERWFDRPSHHQSASFALRTHRQLLEWILSFFGHGAVIVSGYMMFEDGGRKEYLSRCPSPSHQASNDNCLFLFLFLLMLGDPDLHVLRGLCSLFPL